MWSSASQSLTRYASGYGPGITCASAPMKMCLMGRSLGPSGKLRHGRSQFAMYGKRVASRRFRSSLRLRRVRSCLELDTEFRGIRSAGNYLCQLKLHMLELAKGGCVGIENERGVALEMKDCTHGEDITKYLMVPYDTVSLYHSRAVRQASLVVSEERLEWLQSVDVPEREMWVYKIHNTLLPLGQIISQTMTERAAFWVPPKSIQIGHLKAKPNIWRGAFDAPVKGGG